MLDTKMQRQSIAALLLGVESAAGAKRMGRYAVQMR